MTHATKILTLHAAALLPLSLVTGYFGTNIGNVPFIATTTTVATLRPPPEETEPERRAKRAHRK